MAWVKERITSDGIKRYVACYRDPEGRQRSAGTFSSNRAAERAGNREEQRVLAGSWRDHSLGEVRFREYVQDEWLPSKHIEPTTKAAYRSNLDKHFFPFFGRKRLHQVTPGLVQDWVTQAAAGGLSARSIRKYHTMLHSIFVRAVRDGLIVATPCAHTELPKVIGTKSRTLTPVEFDVLLAAIPARYRLMVETAIGTGMRWGELTALKPRHVDFLGKQVTVPDTIMEVSKRHSPTGERYVAKAYPKDNEPRTFGVSQDWLDQVAEHITARHLGRDDLLFATSAGRRSRGTPSAPGSGSPRSPPPVSGSRCGCMTSGTRTPPGCSPAAPTSPPSWTASVTPTSRPPRSTSTRPRTPTRRT